MGVLQMNMIQNIVELDSADIDDAPVNPNRMSPDKYGALVRAIKRLGFLQPLVVEARSDGRFTMRDGHHRRRALVELGMDTCIPSVVVQPGQDAAAVMLAL